MKHVFPILVLLLAAGCRGQVPPNPTTYVCPAATAAAYTPLNQSSPATGLTYTDSKPAAGVYGYIAQSVVSSTGQVSAPSNIAGPYTLSGSNSADLTWTAPTSGPTPTGYVISRAACPASTLAAPALGTATIAEVEHDTTTYQIAENDAPQSPTEPQLWAAVR